MKAPSVSGDRLGLVIGSAIPSVCEAAEGLLILQRHGADHAVPAHSVDHHANVRALCEQGCDRVLAIGSVGSLRAGWPVGTMVCPDDFYAPAANPTFHEDMAGHRVPGFDADWRGRVIDAFGVAGVELRSGIYAQSTGPRFETPAEVRALAREADVVGMTIASEAILAGEAGLAYAAVCVVDNLANGLEAAPLAVEELEAARERTRDAIVRALAAALPTLAESK